MSALAAFDQYAIRIYTIDFPFRFGLFALSGELV
jgi:hypothetical protein